MAEKSKNPRGRTEKMMKMLAQAREPAPRPLPQQSEPCREKTPNLKERMAIITKLRRQAAKDVGGEGASTSTAGATRSYAAVVKLPPAASPLDSPEVVIRKPAEEATQVIKKTTSFEATASQKGAEAAPRQPEENATRQGQKEKRRTFERVEGRWFTKEDFERDFWGDIYGKSPLPAAVPPLNPPRNWRVEGGSTYRIPKVRSLNCPNIRQPAAVPLPPSPPANNNTLTDFEELIPVYIIPKLVSSSELERAGRSSEEPKKNSTKGKSSTTTSSGRSAENKEKKPRI